MPRPSPFHERTFPLNQSWRWKDWAGYAAVACYDPTPIYEYTAVRRSAGLLDVTPLYKYDVKGPDAAALLSRMCVRGFTKMAVGQVAYTCWCDDAGKVVDDGTVSRLDEDHFRVTAAEPTLRWLTSLARGYEVQVSDITANTGALALQGPTSRDILKACSDADLDALGYFQTTAARLGGAAVRISRTGYTGDLGYEVWCEAKDALGVWDALVDAGRAFDLRPIGLEALDMVRVEAGFILLGVDYFSAPTKVLESQKSSPFEIGLGWSVNLKRAGSFVGKRALEREAREGSAWQLVGLEVSWPGIEELYASYGLPPSLPAGTSRVAVPVYQEGAQVGHVTSSVWSPLLKKYLALASVKAPFAARGTLLQVEHTVEYERRTVTGVVTERPFYDPPHRRR